MTKAEQYRDLAYELLAKHVPDREVEVRITNAQRYLGQVAERRNRVTGEVSYTRLSLARRLVNHFPHDEIVDTILHEIAHVMAGATAGHGPKWVAACKAIGARPERTYTGKAHAPRRYKYLSTCPKCEQDTGGFYRRPTATYVCSGCRVPIVLHQQY